MPKIYVVKGTTGEWSDRVEWLAKAFRTEKAAQEFILYLEEKYQSFNQGKRGFNRSEKEEKALNKLMCSLDPRFHEDYTGTSWYYREVELVD